MDLTSTERQMIEHFRNRNLDAREGLDEDLFLMISGLTPIPNVDLLIVNEFHQILLSYRSDEYFGTGWHFPGGCIRFGETMEERIQKTALRELGTKVKFCRNPLAVKDVIVPKKEAVKHPWERGHHITVLYQCEIATDWNVEEQNKKQGCFNETQPGYLKWFAKLPNNLLKVHDVYKDVLGAWLR